MLNNIILVGRLVAKPEMREYEDGTQVCNIRLAVMRPFRNQNTGEFDTDFIPITLWYGTAAITEQYCDKGDVIGIKGRIAEKVKEQNGINIHSLEIIGERVVFISSQNKKYGFVDSKESETINIKA